MALKNPDGIPPELQERDRWHSIGEDKKPLSRDPGPFNKAVAMTVEGYDVGYRLDDDDDLICLDIDHCRGEPWAEDMLTWFPGTYKEISQGGDGYHIWMRGKIPRYWLAEGRSGRFGRKIPGRKLEVYGGRKIMMMTGDYLDTLELTEHPMALRMVLRDYFWPGDLPSGLHGSISGPNHVGRRYFGPY